MEDARYFERFMIFRDRSHSLVFSSACVCLCHIVPRRSRGQRERASELESKLLSANSIEGYPGSPTAPATGQEVHTMLDYPCKL